MIGVYDDLDPELRERVEDVVLNRRGMRASASSRLPTAPRSAGKDDSARLAWRAGDVNARLSHALVHGITDFITEDTEEARKPSKPPVAGRCT